MRQRKSVLVSEEGDEVLDGGEDVVGVPVEDEVLLVVGGEGDEGGGFALFVLLAVLLFDF